MICSKSEIRCMVADGLIFRLEPIWSVKYQGWCIKVTGRNGVIFYVGSKGKIEVYKTDTKAISIIESKLIVRRHSIANKLNNYK